MLNKKHAVCVCVCVCVCVLLIEGGGVGFKVPCEFEYHTVNK